MEEVLSGRWNGWGVIGKAIGFGRRCRKVLRHDTGIQGRHRTVCKLIGQRCDLPGPNNTAHMRNRERLTKQHRTERGGGVRRFCVATGG